MRDHRNYPHCGTSPNHSKQHENLEGKVLIPVYAFSHTSVYDTVEGCTLANCTRDIEAIARYVFNNLPEEQAHRFAFTPKGGEMVERAQFWRAMLAPHMTPKQLHTSMIAILSKYRSLKKMELAANEQCSVMGKIEAA